MVQSSVEKCYLQYTTNRIKHTRLTTWAEIAKASVRHTNCILEPEYEEPDLDTKNVPDIKCWEARYTFKAMYVNPFRTPQSIQRVFTVPYMPKIYLNSNAKQIVEK